MGACVHFNLPCISAYVGGRHALLLTIVLHSFCLVSILHVKLLVSLVAKGYGLAIKPSQHPCMPSSRCAGSDNCAELCYVANMPLKQEKYGLLQGKSHQVRSKLRNDLKPTVIANWKLWVPAQFINFRLVPPHLQVGLMS